MKKAEEQDSWKRIIENSARGKIHNKSRGKKKW